MLKEFQKDASIRCAKMAADGALKRLSRDWLNLSFRYKYNYNFTWLGQPVIKYPQDLVMLQMLISSLKPDVIIETGVAHGGGLLFLASILNLVSPKGMTIGVEQKLLETTKAAILNHESRLNIALVEGNSISCDVLAKVRDLIPEGSKVMVCLDSDHSKSHVLKELELYGPLVSKNSYIVVFDTFIEFLDQPIVDRDFGIGNSPMSAVHEFMDNNELFEIDSSRDSLLMLSEAPSGYLKRIR